ncbi:MAG TPA: hypothetical protein VFV38_05500 [Ktedonobacteraceae bacterium]|nr:hypothetical protein [Ktedonobacteraceae bacterium]
MASKCLSAQQTSRFYRIWFPLLHYVNERLHVVAPFSAIPSEGSVQTADAMHVRNALWEHDALREDFITENPAYLPPEDLALVASWQNRLAGSFYIVRALQAYTVFLTDQAPIHAYGVLGLTSPIEETIDWPIPLLTQAVLLPFEGQITYDSLLTSYAVTFGPNIRHRLTNDYRTAKEREGIITSLDPATTASLAEQRNQIEMRNQKILEAFRKHLAQRGLSLKMSEQHTGTLQAFASTALLDQIPPQGLLSLTSDDVQTYLQTAREKNALTSFKRFVRFLEETDRLEYAQAEALRQAFKQMHEVSSSD